MTRLMVERLYGWSGDLNEQGQWSYYGKVGGVIVTGNEDGGKHCAAQMLYALSHIGFTIPPQADAYWNGEAGPGSVVPRRQPRRAEPLDHAQHRLRRLEHAAHRPAAQGRRRASPRTATSPPTGTWTAPIDRTPRIRTRSIAPEGRPQPGRVELWCVVTLVGAEVLVLAMPLALLAWLTGMGLMTLSTVWTSRQRTRAWLSLATGLPLLAGLLTFVQGSTSVGGLWATVVAVALVAYFVYQILTVRALLTTRR